MKTFTAIRNLLNPLSPSLEKEYWSHQLELISKPLRAVIWFGTAIVWLLVLTIKYMTPTVPPPWKLALVIQAWLVFSYISMKRLGPLRYIAVVLTPLIPSLATYFLTKYTLPLLPTADAMIQHYYLAILLLIIFYAFETLSLWLAVASGLCTSAIILHSRMTTPGLSTFALTPLIVNLSISNLVGIAMCIYGCHKARMQFKFARAAEREREISDSLVNRVFPDIIGQELRTKGSNLARSYQNTTIMLADIANFTKITTTMDPKHLVTILHELFHRFDRLAEQHGVEKIKTIGDAYMAAGGCPTSSKEHAQRIAHFALELLKIMGTFNKQFNTDFQVRVGINSGPVVGGVISGKRISFDIWGETVNLASRLQSVAEPGEIIISDATSKILRKDFVVSEFRMVDIKGLGPTPVARLVSANGKNPFSSGKSKLGSSMEANEIAFLSQH